MAGAHNPFNHDVSCMTVKSLNLGRISGILAEFFLLAIVFSIPLYFAVFMFNNNIFELNKIVLFRILVWALILLTAVKVLAGEDRAGGLGDFFRPFFFRQYLLIPLLFFFALIAATVFSVDRQMSFWGLYDRRQGLVSFIYYFLFFVLLLSRVKNKEQIRRLATAAAMSSFFACIYGIMQKLGLDPMNWAESSRIRITSTMGQPNFFASWLLLVMPLCGYLFFAYRQWAVKIFFAFLFFLQLTCLFFTYSRGGWLGFGGGLAVFTILAARYRFADFFSARKAIFVKIFLSLVILSSVASVYAFHESPLLRERVRGLVDLKSSGAASRMNNLLSGADAVLKRPWLGYGPETQGEVFAGYYRRDWAMYNNANVYPNRAHNIVIDTLMTSGAIGLAAYLLLLVLFVKLSLDNISKKRGLNSFSLFALTAMSAYLISLLFGFAIVATGVYFWLFFALVIVSHRSGNEDVRRIDTAVSASAAPAKSGMRAAYKFFIVFLALACFIYLSGRELKPLTADYYFREAKKALISGNYPLSFTLWSYTEGESGGEKYYDRQFGEMLAGRMDLISSASLREIAEGILVNIFDYLGESDYHDIFSKAKMATILAAGGDKDFAAAEELWQKAIALSPEMPQNYYGLGKMYYLGGEYGRAIENYRLALSALPDMNDAGMTTPRLADIYLREYYCYAGLANAYAGKNDLVRAEANAQLARAKDDGIARFKAGAAERLRGDLSQAALEYEEGWRLNPDDFSWPYMLAQLNRRMGNEQQAVYYAGEALRLAPDNRSVKALNDELL